MIDSVILGLLSLAMAVITVVDRALAQDLVAPVLVIAVILAVVHTVRRRSL